MKFEIKKIITEVPLHCIASFVIGAYTIFLVEFFCYDNHITTAGASACIASMALLFTIYAAFKVKAWSEQKMNDKAFSTAEKIIDSLNKAYVEFMFASHALIELASKTDASNVFEHDPAFSYYEKTTIAASNELKTCLTLIDTLPIWKFHTPYKDMFFDFETAIRQFATVADDAINVATSGTLHRTVKFRAYKEPLIKEKRQVVLLYSELKNLTFDKIFIPL